MYFLDIQMTGGERPNILKRRYLTNEIYFLSQFGKKKKYKISLSI